MKDFKTLQVWHKSHAIVLRVYKVTASFPKEELYGLTSQIRRAAVSIPANLAEGCGRDTQAEYARFVHIASGFAVELEYHLLLAHDLGFIDQTTYTELDASVNEVKKMLTGFAKTLQSNVALSKSKN